MGCMCSTPKVVEHHRLKDQLVESRPGLRSVPRSILSAARVRSRGIEANVLPVQEVLELAQDVCMLFKDAVDPLILAAIALVQSGGNPKAYRWEEHVGEASNGLCQMLLSTAQWLMSLGYDKYPVTTASDLHVPRTALYYGAAYLERLSEFNGQHQSEEFVVRAYTGGPKNTSDPSTDAYWLKYKRAKKQLQKLQWAIGQAEIRDVEADGPFMHVVQSGETLNLIAKVCGTTVQRILDVNPEIKDANLIRAGDCIEIPVKRILPRFYVVQPGDTMAGIAQRHDVSLMRLLRANPDIKSPSLVQSGWVISLPGLRGTSSEQADPFDRSDLISTSFDDGAFFLAAMAGKYGIPLDDNLLGEGMGILSPTGHDALFRLRRFRGTPTMSTGSVERRRI